METAPLKNFATWARTALIREVTARIAAVLAPGSSERVEQTKAIAALEKAVSAAGGGDKGRSAVADKVAYTWFNRIIALRFMDANGYTGIGVVSPQAGVEVGQPEILAEAKRGVIDEVIGDATRRTVAALLDGTRASGDPQGEAYALLLEAHCNYWHKAMPFMFEREGDFTELLIPANLLADDSVLNRSVKVLTKDVCKDVEVIGWLYQFYISERKDEVFAGFAKRQKAGAAEIPPATQLFTPHWIVRYIVENTLGRLWVLNRPSSPLIDQMAYYVTPIDDEADFLKITSPEQLTVIDPACGSGHMLTYAFDLLYAIYEEEGYAPSEIPALILTHNLHGTELDPRAGALAGFALAMKARAKQRTFFSEATEPNICVLEPISFMPSELDLLVTEDGDRADEIAFWTQFEHADTFGSLIQCDPDLAKRLSQHVETIDDGGDMLRAGVVERAFRALAQADPLARNYAVVTMNPPYMGSKHMGDLLSGWVTAMYPRSKSDLMTAFMDRAQTLCAPSGFWGMINLPSWMFLKSFESLRYGLVREATIESLLHLGRGIFGSDFGSVAFVVSRTTPTTGHRGVYRRLFREHVAVRSVETIRQLFLDMDLGRYEASQASFADIPGSPIVYWLPETLRRSFVENHLVRDTADPKQGLATADNGRFVRKWWEVSGYRTAFDCTDRDDARGTGRRWFPYNKGGEWRRWYGNQEHVVNWEQDGSAIRSFGSENGGRPRSAVRNHDTYFQPSVSWSDVTSGPPAFRRFPNGFIHDVTGMSVFRAGSQEPKLLAVLNSSVTSALLQAVAPTIHFQVGDIAILPVPAGDLDGGDGLAETLVATSKIDWDDFETSWNFRDDPLVATAQGRSLQETVASNLRKWDELSERQRSLEEQNNQAAVRLFGLQDEVPTDVTLDRVSLTRNTVFRYPDKSKEERDTLFTQDAVKELISYAVGCMLGRYSLGQPGLILADQGSTLRSYLEKVPTPPFMPDEDNVIPIVDGEWFEDDIVARLRLFLRTAFGDERFEENFRFVTESLGVKDLREYFITKAGKSKFYDEHIQRYKKRPIYWLFSSPKGSFNALIYMHRYTPSTVSTVLNEYLREFQTKLKASLEHAERSNNAKEADRLRAILLELDEYEHDVLYPLASQNIAIDLDDGVKTNYPKFGAALKKIAGLEAAE